MSDIYSFQVRKSQGETVSLGEFRGRVLLIVNVASQCVFTSQYEGLQKLHEQYHEQGLSLLAFPCNQFGGQEPGSEEEIQQFCSLKYHVDFEVYSKLEVNGPNAAPLYSFLKKQAPGLLGSQGIKWNFTKFLVDRNGKVLARYSPSTPPSRLEAEIREALKSLVGA